VSCVVEVAHSSIHRDRAVKLPIYAHAGIGQYVLINLENNSIEVYTDPEPASEQYRSKTTLARADKLAIRLPQGGEFVVTAAEVLP
jgi:hypothetical protein